MEADSNKRQCPEYNPATWEPERSWDGNFEPCSYNCVDGSVIICACKNKNKHGHIGTNAHKAWLEEIRPLEEQRRSAAANAEAEQLQRAGADESSGSDNDSSHVPVREGSGAVAEALDGADADGLNNDFAYIFDGPDPISDRLRAAEYADADDDDCDA